MEALRRKKEMLKKGGREEEKKRKMKSRLKVHKHEIILIFFLPKSNPYMPFVNFCKKILLLFLRFSPEFRCSNISAVTKHTRNQIFFERYPKIFFLQNLHFGPIR
jgi:hypothetical protein